MVHRFSNVFCQLWGGTPCQSLIPLQGDANIFTKRVTKVSVASHQFRSGLPLMEFCVKLMNSLGLAEFWDLGLTDAVVPTS